MTERCDVAVVGSGFAGSILARALAVAGRRVVLLERGRHPRFALGESSTPLAALSLERLADRYGLPDLRALAAYGRWRRELPEVAHGLKRGFTFLAHRRGRPLAASGNVDPPGTGRLLVAASPTDEVADSHWLRSSVDAYLAARAVEAGADLRDEVELTAAEEEPGGLRLSGRWRGRPLDLRAGFVVDGSGAGRFLARHLPIPPLPDETTASRPASRPASALLYGHFEGALPLAEAAPDLGPPGPYPDERAAVHHLLDEGWAYALRFDSGRLSAGIELPLDAAGRFEGLEAAADDPAAAFRRIVERYPTLAAQLGPAVAVEPIRLVPRLQYRLARAAGCRWILLPSSFASTGPLYSTGIAWSLLAVERAAAVLERDRPPAAETLDAYHTVLALEADWIDRLVAGGLRARGRFEAFSAWCTLYFAAAAFTESAQRLVTRAAPWHGEAFLGAQDRVLREALRSSETGLDAVLAGGAEEADFRRRVVRAVRARDVVGFDLPDRRGLHPVDLGVLVDRAHLLGLSREQVEAALPRLRGTPEGARQRPVTT